jgi:pimeloyl-ACP methyl ester carboxylesterase
MHRCALNVAEAELRHAYDDVDGVSLHWAELGVASDHAPIVLLHGLMDSHLSWRAPARELARDRLVLMPDLPGCGLSARPDASYTLEWHAHMIARWLERRELRKVDVVGHSFGGGVAQMLLLECPERIRRLVLVAAGGLGRGVIFWLKLGTVPYFVEHWGQPYMAFGTRRALPTAHGEEGELDARALSVMNSARGSARAFSRTVRDVINFRGQRRRFDQRVHELGSLPPIAVLWGERDRIIPIAHGRAFTEHMIGARFTSFPDCGHHLHQEDPAGFVSAVREFLDDPSALPVLLPTETVEVLPRKRLWRPMLWDKLWR